MNDWSDEETDDPLLADDRNFYKVEEWTRDGMKVDSLLYAGNNLSKAQEIFANAINHRSRIRLTIRQRTRGSATVAPAEMAGLTRAQSQNLIVIWNEADAQNLHTCGIALIRLVPPCEVNRAA